MPRRGKRFIRFISCACGCERLLLDLDNKGRTRKFIDGHQYKVRNLKGKNNRAWKGGIAFSHGYVLIHKPSHPLCSTKGYVFLHRLIMEKHIGRYLTPDEDVHHINGIKTENLFYNLKLLTHGEHARLTRLNRKCD
jgi:hypothetical protein